jgi:hypothetical protein
MFSASPPEGDIIYDASVTACAGLIGARVGWFVERVEEIGFVADRGFERDAPDGIQAA